MKKSLKSILGLSLWVVLVILGVQIVLSLIFSLILKDKVNQAAWITIYSALVYALSLVVIVFLPTKISKTYQKPTRDSLGLTNLPTWTDIGLSVVGFVVYLVCSAIVVGIFSSIFSWFDPKQIQELGYSRILFGADRIIAMISLVVIAPIAEEIIFRGFLYQKLKHQLKNIFPDKTKSTRRKIPNILPACIAALLVSVIFGALHGQWNVGINVLAMSLVLCGMREITGTIYSGIIMHMLKNALAYYFVYILGIA